MTDSIIQNGLMFLGFIVAVVGGIFTAFKYFSAEIKAARQAAEDYTKLALESEARQRHTLANNIQTMNGKIEADMRDLESRTVALSLDTARKTDLEKLEQRFTEVVRDIKTSLTSEIRRMEEGRQQAIDKLDVKIEAMNVKLTEWMVAHTLATPKGSRLPHPRD